MESYTTTSVLILTALKLYIGETGRALGDRSMNTQRLHPPSIFTATLQDITFNPDCFTIIQKKTHSSSRTIKEAMFIRVNDPTLNRNLGMYQLLHGWDNILHDMPTLQFKPSSLSFLPHYHPLLGHPISQSPYTLTTPNHKSQAGGTCTFIGRYHMGVTNTPKNTPNLLPSHPY